MFSFLLTEGQHLTHCMLVDSSTVRVDESICHFKSIGSILSLLFYFLWKILLANNVDPDQMPHHVTSDLGVHCLPLTTLRVSK